MLSSVFTSDYAFNSTLKVTTFLRLCRLIKKGNRESATLVRKDPKKQIDRDKSSRESSPGAASPTEKTKPTERKVGRPSNADKLKEKENKNAGSFEKFLSGVKRTNNSKKESQPEGPAIEIEDQREAIEYYNNHPITASEMEKTIYNIFKAWFGGKGENI